jgi:hypothetical protein
MKDKAKSSMLSSVIAETTKHYPAIKKTIIFVRLISTNKMAIYIGYHVCT